MSSSLKTGDQLISSVVKQDYTTHPSAVLLGPHGLNLSVLQKHNASSRSGAVCGLWGQ